MDSVVGIVDQVMCMLLFGNNRSFVNVGSVCKISRANPTLQSVKSMALNAMMVECMCFFFIYCTCNCWLYTVNFCFFWWKILVTLGQKLT